MRRMRSSFLYFGYQKSGDVKAGAKWLLVFYLWQLFGSSNAHDK
ncbi:hypothetical protein [uncultured Enterococcus sp.]|nr:hypothetical protein [uncultured Enterococcus sp.]